MSSYQERKKLTDVIEQKIPQLFCDAVVQEFGCTQILGNNPKLLDYLKLPEINQMPSGLIIKFAPDFIIFNKFNQPDQHKIFFLDVKNSVTPIYSTRRVSNLQAHCNDYSLKISDIGVVAREALLSYRRYYPGTIILMASPYNKQKIMAQFANKVKCLGCFKGINSWYDCNNCPSKNGGFFDIEKDNNSTGSQTPMTNVDLNSFESARIFFSKIGLKINEQILDDLEKIVISEPIAFDKKVDATRKQEILRELAESGCYWLENQNTQSISKNNSDVYSCDGNDYIHLDANCYFLKNKKIIKYPNIEAAKKAGKLHMCHYCGSK